VRKSRVDYVLGLARNRGCDARSPVVARSQAEPAAHGKRGARIREFFYRTRSSWSALAARVAKAEHLPREKIRAFV